uniref:Uncharacterized protein n=1 Tax=Pan troglodytes TaxID=9598 RepID=G2HGN1_PANTR|nr:hypothetical protein [Pan troglodytes]
MHLFPCMHHRLLAVSPRVETREGLLPFHGLNCYVTLAFLNKELDKTHKARKEGSNKSRDLLKMKVHPTRWEQPMRPKGPVTQFSGI